ncbi:MAG: 50S ribosomal protein L20 [Phycisphaeraceae bacterium]
MPRTTKGAARRQAKVRWFKKTKGNRGARRNHWSRTKETVFRAGVYQYEHRRTVKREYRQLWITRISAACQMRNISYSRFIAGLKGASIALNRKMLSEIAIHDPATFDKLVEQARAGLEVSAPKEA